MKASLTTFLAVAVFATGFALPSVRAAAADSEDPQPAGRIGRALARELELSREQRAALKDIVRTHQPVLRPLREQAQTERTDLRALIAAPTLDETALAVQADRIATTHKQIVIASARMRADLRKILTTEQLTKLEGWRAHTKARLHAGRDRFSAWLMEP